MATKRKTQNQIQFDKELRRIKRLIRRAETRGFDFTGLIQSGLLDRPKRVTRTRLEQLRAIRGTAAYAYAQYTDPTTGEYTSGTEGRRLERQRAGRRGYQNRQARLHRITVNVSTPNGLMALGGDSGERDTASQEEFFDEIIQNFGYEILNLPPRLIPKMQALVSMFLSTFSKASVATAIFQMDERLIEILQRCAYDSGDFLREVSTKLYNGIISFADTMGDDGLASSARQELENNDIYWEVMEQF